MDKFTRDVPGVRLRDALRKLSESSLSDLLPSGLEPALHALKAGTEDDTDLCDAVADVLEPRDVLTNSEKRPLLLQTLPRGKREELSKRVSIPPDQLIDAEYDSDQLRALIGFFGGSVDVSPLSDTTARFEVVDPKHGLFDYQREAARGIEDYLNDEVAVLPSALLHMPTGSGKTRTTMHVLCSHLAEHEPSTIVWLADSSELLEQASGAFQRAWKILGNRTVRVGQYWGQVDSLERVKDGIIVAGLQKLHALRKRDEEQIHALAQATDFVVVDEAHISVAETYSQLIDMLRRKPSTKLLGLTATPGRTWNSPKTDAELSSLYDRNKVGISIEGYESPVTYLIENDYLARPTFRTLDLSGKRLSPTFDEAEIDFSSGDELSSSLSMDQRTAYLVGVVREVQKLVERHRRILVFAASVSDARNVSLLLRREDIRSDVITGETNKSRRRAIIRAYRSDRKEPHVIVNYGVLTAGFDAPQTSAALIARPTRSLVLYSQMVGRAIRGPKANGNETAEIVTLVDTSLPGFGSVAAAFENWEDVWNG